MLPVNAMSQLRLFFLLFMLIFTSACTPEKHTNTSLIIQDDTLCQFKLGVCVKNVASVELALLITPFDSPSEKPLTVSLTSSKEIEDLKVRIEGRDMFMGVIPVNLSKVGENIYKGSLMYGSCSSSYMVWRVFVSFTLQGEKKVVLYDFLADNNI
ncbi:hypothetical protein HWQ46_00405 [Shewanella sp. D64]|uniref:hypothetical protein n=1 Tax=unclassified Shewanella TaxID=196818 RepID=UPI0022BA60C2|nr:MULTISPECIES: hypothetical protein [unclassified Shewanella]MEC4724013.1 hypothetical protein [Shewanella sp. D64]MEC4736033.1 hypothetical protein [Shewanella sp. E94]WBJ98021.1 hypothetical protein HWQ47_13450 [Shewanella sp. MTB7]